MESVRIHLLEAGSDFRRSSSSCAKCYLLPSPALHYNAALALLRPARLCNLCNCFKVVFPTSSMRVCRSSQSLCFCVLSQRKMSQNQLLRMQPRYLAEPFDYSMFGWFINFNFVNKNYLELVVHVPFNLENLSNLHNLYFPSHF